MNAYSKPICYLENNSIILNSNKFGWPQVVDVFKKIYKLNVVDNIECIELDFNNVKTIYPDGIIPLIGYIGKYKSQLNIKLTPPKDTQTREYAERMGWFNYIDPQNHPALGHSKFAIKLFNDDESLNTCVNEAIELCLKELDFAKGVLPAFEWALNELTGNSLVHSGANYGVLQVLPDRPSHTLNIVVCDSGVGIPFNMKNAFPAILNDKIAIEYALKKGVTSNPKYGQGNGLAGTLAIAQASSGRLKIGSGKGRVEVANGQIKSKYYFPPTYGTVVIMQLPTDKPIDLPKTLWGTTPVSYLEMRYEKEDGEDLLIKLKEHSPTFGNRPTGEKIRTIIENLLKEYPGKRLVVCMADIEIIASSFADELFGKLFVKLGAMDFFHYVMIDNLNTLCKNIIDAAIHQRVAQNYEETHTVTKIKDFDN